MGAEFEAKFANFFGYLSDNTNAAPPRTSKRHLEDFLASLAYSYEVHNYVGGSRFETSTSQRARLISSKDWADRLRETSQGQLNRIERQLTQQELVPVSLVSELLRPLKKYFDGYSFYAMIFWNQSDYVERVGALSIFEEIAIESRSKGLIFNPRNYNKYLDFLDPFPCVAALASHPVEFPAIVFWTSEGDTVALSLNEAIGFFWEKIVPLLSRGSSKILGDLFRKTSERQRTKRILHMSDLHFGKPEAARRRQYLKGELEFICRDVDRVVITGDLFDNPTVDLRSEFDEFKSDVERFTRKPIVTIPGNHDVRKKGNVFGSLGESYKHAATLWQPLEVDDELRTLFFNFDSCEGGNFARGRVTENQRLKMTALYNDARRENPDVVDYVKIALVHHHPLKFQSEQPATTLYQRAIEAFFKPDQFLAFENADEFNHWCISRDVSLILHGHKHFPRQAELENGTLVVGCGSTMGVEETPMCYDVVTLSEDSKNWSVSFYQDRAGDGSGFRLQSITLEATS